MFLHRYFIRISESFAVYRIRMGAGTWQGHYWDANLRAWLEDDAIVQRYWNGFGDDVAPATEEGAADALLKLDWSNLPAGDSWSYRLAPPLPCEWPPTRAVTLRSYAYAWRPDDNVELGFRVSAPWASIETTPDGDVSLTSLAATLRDLGTQSVWPLSPQEAAALELQDAAEACLKGLAALPAPEPAVVIRRFYRTWCAGNGVLVKQIQAGHQEFFDWLMNPMSPSRKS